MESISNNNGGQSFDFKKAWPWLLTLAIVLFVGYLFFGGGFSNRDTKKSETDQLGSEYGVDLYQSAGQDLQSAWNKQKQAEASRERYLRAAEDFSSRQNRDQLGSGSEMTEKEKFDKWNDEREYEKWKRCHPQDECNQDCGDQKKTEKVVAPKNSSKSKSKASVSSTQKPTVNNYNYNYYYDREEKKETVEVKKSDCGCKKEDRVYNSPTSNDCECPSTPLPENYSDYNKSNLLSQTGCHGFREKGVNGKTEDFRFKNVEEARIFFDANQYGIFKGRQRNF